MTSEISKQASPKSKRYQSPIALIFVILVIAIISASIFRLLQPKEPTNFKECIQSPNSKILGSYPQQCVTKAGKNFIQDITVKDSLTPTERNNPATICNANGGVWLDKYNECEFINRQTCESSGGSFDECQSSCRHQKGAQNCNMMCVPVCKY